MKGHKMGRQDCEKKRNDQAAPLILEGGSALSQFRLNALCSRMKKAAPLLDIATVEAQYVYFIEAGAAMSDQDLARTFALLAAHRPSGRQGGFVVMPRKGTISPWSSKATDIFHNCGLAGVLRVERGIQFKIYQARNGRDRAHERNHAQIPLS
ncbi:MAG: hypothetical protein WCP86_08425, partial [bacterium]